ncbi:ATP-binding protein [Halobacteriovorax sp. HLS]|uniref:ATP-binding protein n=1 Tax=Halobacteriovorax sp. HLS TaxID=2234000 RepID=UPI0013E2B3D9|nr:ATP-binding protein [Halobacteriovorax sp. HLS]
MNLKWLGHIQNSNKIATKVFVLLVVFSTLVTIIFSLAQTYQEYISQEKFIENQISNIDKNLMEGLTDAVWHIDLIQINNIILSLYNRDYIHYVNFENNDGVSVEFGDKNIKNKISTSIDVFFNKRKESKKLGRLVLQSDKRYLFETSKRKFISIFFYNGLIVLAIAAALVLLVTRYIAIPLHNLSLYSRTVFENGDANNFNFKDEFAEVADTIKLMYFDLDRNFQEIKKSEERFRDMSQFKKRIVWETDLSFVVTYVSDSLKTNTLGKYMLELEPWASCSDSLLEKVLILKSLQSFRDLEVNFLLMGTPCFWSVSAKPFFDDKGRHIGYRFISEDITQSKLLQDRLEQQKEQMRQSQKLESLGQITGGLTHDFNNLLMIIQGSLRNISKSIERGKDFNKYLKSATGAVDRGRKLTKKLLIYSRKEVLSPTKQNIDFLISDMQDMLEKCLNEKIELKVKLALDKSEVLIDPIELENACINMAINSRDAMPDGGVISLSTRKVFIEDPDELIERGEYIVLSFKDTGKGIAPHLVDKVFEPFFTTKEIGQGTGLGLSQIYGFMKDSKGKVELHSSVNEGTCIEMFFPVIQQKYTYSVPVI